MWLVKVSGCTSDLYGMTLHFFLSMQGLNNADFVFAIHVRYVANAISKKAVNGKDPRA